MIIIAGNVSLEAHGTNLRNGYTGAVDAASSGNDNLYSISFTKTTLEANFDIQRYRNNKSLNIIRIYSCNQR